jgi:hypothetical protein
VCADVSAVQLLVPPAPPPRQIDAYPAHPSPPLIFPLTWVRPAQALRLRFPQTGCKRIAGPFQVRCSCSGQELLHSRVLSGLVGDSLYGFHVSICFFAIPAAPPRDRVHLVSSYDRKRPSRYLSHQRGPSRGPLYEFLCSGASRFPALHGFIHFAVCPWEGLSGGEKE